MTSAITQLRPVVSKASLLASVVMEQSIIQAAISSVETYDGTKSKSEAWTASVENAAQVSKQSILHISFSKMIGPPLTSACRLRDHFPYLMWWDLRSELSRQCLKYLSTVMPPKLLPASSKAPLSYLRCTCIVPVNTYQKYIKELTWLKSLQKV